MTFASRVLDTLDDVTVLPKASIKANARIVLELPLSVGQQMEANARVTSLDWSIYLTHCQVEGEQGAFGQCQELGRLRLGVDLGLGSGEVARLAPQRVPVVCRDRYPPCGGVPSAADAGHFCGPV
jgi:hypothetical protein